MARTKTIWTAQQYENNPDPNWQQIFINKSNEMASQGKTDGVPFITNNSQTQEVIVERTWISPAAAQEWQDFIAPYNPVWSQTFDP